MPVVARVGGTALGAYLGDVNAGSALGNAAGNMISGSGRYSYGRRRRAVRNSLMGSGRAAEIPTVSSAMDETGRITVSRTEYIQDIFGPPAVGGQVTPFQLLKFDLNPGIERTFNWASQLAQNYDEYEMVQCIFHYRSTTTDIGSSSNGQCGTIIMATQYNVNAPVFASKAEMMEYSGSMSAKTTTDMSHGVECSPKKRSGSAGKYVRSTNVVDDISDYDYGIFQLAIANSPAGFSNQVLGELWVTYKFVLRKPKFHTGSGKGITSDSIYYMPRTHGVLISEAANTSNFWLGEPTTQSFGKWNTMNLKLLKEFSTSGSATSAGAANYILYFPSDISGHFKVVVNVKGDNLGGNWNDYNIEVVSGNIIPIEDMIIGGNPITAPIDPGNNKLTSLRRIKATDFVYLEAHMFIQSATGGADNVLRIARASNTTGQLQSASVEVSEYQYAITYKEANQGKSTCPILVDVGGNNVPQTVIESVSVYP